VSYPTNNLKKANDHAGAGPFMKGAMRMGFYSGCENSVSLSERYFVTTNYTAIRFSEHLYGKRYKRLIAVPVARYGRFSLALDGRMAKNAEQGRRCLPQRHSALNKRDLHRRFLIETLRNDYQSDVDLAAYGPAGRKLLPVIRPFVRPRAVA
jgi:hypothetical protein